MTQSNLTVPTSIAPSADPREAIASINAYTRGTLDVTVLAAKRQARLTGQLCTFPVTSEIGAQNVLARINRVDMTNAIHGSSDFQQVIADMGRLPHYSGVCDVLTARVEILGCKSDALGLGALACPPPSGTLLNEASAEELIEFQVDECQGTIGHITDRPELPMSIVSRHFGEHDDGGHGEAKHTAIFGQNGSGKTILGLALTALQLAANPEMGALIPDTAGDLTRKGGHKKGSFQFNFHDLMASAGRQVHLYEIADIRLNSPKTFEGLMTRFLRTALNTTGEKAAQVAAAITSDLFDKDVDIAIAQPERVVELLPEAIANSYAKNSRAAKLEDLREKMSRPNQRRRIIEQYRSQVMQFFEGKHSLRDVIEDSMCNGQIVMIRMNTMSEVEQAMVMGDVFYQLRKTAQDRFRQNHETFNGLVVLDEGPRWVPQGRDGNSEIADTIVDAFNTTRKLGIGWTIISQRISALSKDVVAQCHTKFTGKGLGIGADRDHLQRFFGDDGVAVYDQLALRGGYFWLGSGDLVNYGQGSQYFSFDTFGGNATEALKAANPHIWR